ncbi:MAG TPA: hypothetical protein VM029_22225 [Opitutaceae bacterium]|nr:hypothetical protein [Opitutaceae bacterium]
MKRRTFIGIAAAGTAGMVLPATGGGSVPAAVLENPRLLQILRNKRTVREIGRRYRKIVPRENDAQALAQAILPDARGAGSASLPAAINAQIQRDFADGRTLTLDGWVLSVTEARQCALYSLLPA